MSNKGLVVMVGLTALAGIVATRRSTTEVTPPPPESTALEKFTVVIRANDNGLVYPTSGVYNFSFEEPLTVWAIPDPWFILDRWSINGALYAGENPIEGAVVSDLDIQPVFV